MLLKLWFGLPIITNSNYHEFVKNMTLHFFILLSYILGVGKTSLTYLIAHNRPLISPGWTVGCSVEVKLHKYKEGTQAQNTFFVELWDVGGSNGHRNTRDVFYQPTHGMDPF